VELRERFRFQQSGYSFFCSSARIFALCEYFSLSSTGSPFHASPSNTLIALLSLPGCCCINSSRNFLANSINPFIGRLGLSGSFTFFLAGDIGGDIMLPRGSREAIPWRSGPPLGPPGDSCSARSALLNSNRLNRSQRSGVLTASGWLGGKQTSPLPRSWHGIPNFSRVWRGRAEHQPLSLTKNG